MSYGGSSGGSNKIATAADTALSNPVSGDALTYNASLQKWTNTPVSGSGAADATSSVKGVVKLAGDLGGTAASPTVSKLNGLTLSGTPASGKYLDGSGAWTTLPAGGALGNSGVTAGSYGSASAVPVITVNSQGLITAASTAAVAGGSGGSGGGADDTLVYNAAAHNILPTNSDNSSAINSLITTVNAGGGGVIVFPAGDYTINSTINLKGGVYLSSMTGNHGYIAANPAAKAVKFSAGSGLTNGAFMIDTNGGWSCGIDGIDLSGNYNCGGIRFQGIYWGAIRRSMANACTIGFCQTSGFACVYEDLMATNCVGDSVGAETGAADIDGTDHYITRCELTSGSQNNALKNANKYCAAIVLRGSNHFVDNCVFETSDVGLSVRCTNTRFSNVRADTNNGDGFHIYSGGNTFTGCSAIGNSQAATGVHTDWIVESGAWGNHFAACVSQTAGSKKPKYGFWDMSNGVGGYYASKYVGCSVDQSADLRWYITGTAAVEVPLANYKPDATSTLSVEGVSGVLDTGNFTSPTTISSIVGGVPHQTIRLLGTPNITIANNSTIKTPTGANVTLATNRLYSLTYYAGIWYMQ